MNKKFLYGMFSVAGMLLATSCSSDELIEQSTGDTATVSFNLTTEGASATRAISDGTGADKLYYAVYDKDGKLLESISKKDGEDGSDLTSQNGHKFTLALAKGQQYTVAFWAQATNAPYGITIENNQFDIAMNYGGVNNNESRDAFFYTETFSVSGNATKNIKLKRPFAQINVGTSDADAAEDAGFKVSQMTSQVVIKNAANKLNVLTAEPIGDAVEVTYQHNARPTEDLNVTGLSNNPYTWLSMCYVLPTDGENSTTVAAEFEFKADEKTIKLSEGLQNIPVQRNYRTNIIGSLLTDQVNFKVVVDPNFLNEPGHVVEVWDGVTTQEPTLNTTTNTYEVANAAQFAWLGGKSLEKNVKLTGDINLGGHELLMIYPDLAGGVFDGNGYTISNISYVGDPTTRSHQPYKSGLFSFETAEHLNSESSSYTIKNLTIDNLETENYLITQYNVYGYAGALVADKQNGGTLNIDSVTIKNSTIKGIQSVGALIGLHNCGTVNVSNTTISGNNISNISVEDESGYVCGLVGKVVGKLVIGENVKIENNTIDAYYASKRGAVTINEVAATRANGTIKGTATTVSNTVNKRPITAPDYTISTATDLRTFAENVERDPAMYTGKIVALNNDIDLAGVDFKVIGHASNSEFRGTFDGNGYTIKNLTINEPDGYAEYDAVGFFGWVGNNGSGIAKIKNVNFKNANITGHKNVAVIAGNLQFGHIENCSVDGFELNCTAGTNGRDGDKCGALVGIAQPNPSYVSVKNCKVSNGTINAASDAGQAIGCCVNANVRNDITGITINNVTVSANGTGTGANINNAIIGRKN